MFSLFTTGEGGKYACPVCLPASLCKSLAADAVATIRNASVPSILLNSDPDESSRYRSTLHPRLPMFPSLSISLCLSAFTVIVSCLCFVCNWIKSALESVRALADLTSSSSSSGTSACYPPVLNLTEPIICVLINKQSALGSLQHKS